MVSTRRVGLIASLIIIAAAGAVTVAWFLASSEPTVDTKGAASLARDVQRLRVGLSRYTEAQAIAEKYGTRRFEHHYGLANCPEDNFRLCAYVIPLPQTNNIRLRLPWARVDSGRSHGDVWIWIREQIVVGFDYRVFFRTTNGQWRGAGVEADPDFFDPNQKPHTPDVGYQVVRHGFVFDDSRKGEGLHARLTPTTSNEKHQTAWSFDFRCLDNKSGCTDVCELAPALWRDFREQDSAVQDDWVRDVERACGTNRQQSH
jgi:hypothetical protein